MPSLGFAAFYKAFSVPDFSPPHPGSNVAAGPRLLIRQTWELQSMNKDDMVSVFKLSPNQEENLFEWNGHLHPTSPPYNQGAFKLHIEFCPEFPFKPPKILFKTPIYHPNIDEKGQICLPLIAPENWKPATTVPNIIQKLLALLADPEIEHPLRADLAEEYARDKNKFLKNAEEFTKKHAEKRF
ncbi:Ubiquitin-conjugating enzyme E2 L3 [Sparganum proliferum]